jgi:hypothetical protein
MVAGRVNDGLVLSCTVTVKLPVAVCPRVSLATQVTVVVPMVKLKPEPGEHVTGREPSTASAAVAV